MRLLFESTNLIEWGGVVIIALLIFSETGLLVGLIIPGGETLVFTAGLLTSTHTLDISIYLLVLILILCGIAGDASGYYIGKKFGQKLYHKNDTWFFKKQYLQIAENFLKKYSRLAIIAGKFFPLVRPFTPVISGTTGYRFFPFLSLTVIAVITYMCVFSFGGYFLGRQFPQIQQYLGWILPITIIITLIPVALQIVRKNKKENHDKTN